jgi:2-dehydropantoate 2-reductase
MHEGGEASTVVVIGAGGLGSYVGAVLTRAGHDVAMVVRGAHAEAVRANGLEVRAPEESFRTRPHCIAPGAAIPRADVVFIAVKAYSLDEVTESVVTLAEGGAIVVPLLNGVDVSKRLEAAGVPGDRLVDGVAYLTAFRTEPGVIERKGAHQRLVIGSTTGAGPEGLERVRALFPSTPVEVVVAEDIRVEIWLKMAVVCSLAVICGVTGDAIGPIRRHEFGRDLQAGAIAEVLGVGRALGVELPSDAEARVGGTLDAFPEDFYPSVLHDLRNGRPTEMDSLAGTIARLGRGTGVETPLAAAATCAVALVGARTQSGPG